MIAIIQFKNFFNVFCYLKMYRLKHKKLYYQLFHVGVKLGL